MGHNFPATDQAISETTTLHTDIQSIVLRLHTEMKDNGERVSHTETKMGEFAQAFTELVDSHNGPENDIVWLKSKIADMENRSRRNNLKIRGIPESFSQENLSTFVTGFFKSIVPKASDRQNTPGSETFSFAHFCT